MCVCVSCEESSKQLAVLTAYYTGLHHDLRFENPRQQAVLYAVKYMAKSENFGERQAWREGAFLALNQTGCRRLVCWFLFLPPISTSGICIVLLVLLIIAQSTGNVGGFTIFSSIPCVFRHEHSVLCSMLTRQKIH